MAVLSGATASHRQMYQGQPGTTATTLYTAPAASANVTSPSATAYIKEIVVTNTTSNSQYVNVYLVPNGGSAGNGNFLAYFSFTGEDTKVLSGLNTAMPAGSTIQAIAQTAGIMTLTISGVEVQ